MNKQVEKIRAEIERQKDVFRPSIASINGNSTKVVLQDLLNFIDDMEDEDDEEQTEWDGTEIAPPIDSDVCG